MATLPPTERNSGFSIGEAVTRVRDEFPETSHSGLHFLEREGLLSTARTAGGHRLYRDIDVQRILQIKRWQREGLSLSDIRANLERRDQHESASDLADAFLDLSSAGRRADALRIVRESIDFGLAPDVLFDDVIVPVLVEVGRRWQIGQLLVAQEKEISEIAREAITDITLRYSPRLPTGHTIVAACIAGELHELGLRMISGLLRIHGLDVHFLGANVASAFLRESVDLHRPAAVLLSARDAANLPALEATLDVLRAPGSQPLLIVGGWLAEANAATVRDHGGIPLDKGTVSEAATRVRTLIGK